MALTNDAIRKPNVAGSFYEPDPQELKNTITSLLNIAKPPPKPLRKKRIRAIISPHAGYMYCATIMASAYRLLQGKHYKRAILIGPSHSVAFSTMAFDTARFWETPLGRTAVDQQINEQFLYHPEFDVLPTVFTKEHSLEVQLPFLQTVLPSFSLIPLCSGQNVNHREIAKTLQSVLTEDTLVVVSSDFSHYHPEKQARLRDQHSMNAILSQDTRAIETEVDACGLEGIKILNDISIEELWTPIFLEYTTSASVTGEIDAVVGYASLAYV